MLSLNKVDESEYVARDINSLFSLLVTSETEDEKKIVFTFPNIYDQQENMFLCY